MFLTRSEYDRGVNTFSPEGRLFQVEYAIEAIKLGSTAVGIQTSQGVILAVEKRVTSPLLVSSSIEKIMEIDSHLGCAMSGLVADSRTMIDHARVEAQNHTFTYEEKIKVESVTQAICDLALRFGESAHGEESIMSRPFGVALLVAGIDEKGPQLFHTDPSGTFMKYNAKAIGSGSEGAQTELQEEYHKSITLEEAETLSLKVLKQVMEEKLNNTNVQLASSRPFGVALLVAGIDEKGPQLFHTDPSGTFMKYNAKAIGSGSEGAQTELQEEYHKSITLEEAETLSLKVLKQVMEEKLNNTNVQLASVTPDRGFRIYSEDELQVVIDRL
ncbi:hypothetical protein Glove_81g61 [Diversispora epigaea]|uniref:Proteasome alpha-type subunits domain-containing protein n=1 Tax=Diversispora epigaea TaxID=1348612 RepID=A0A397J8X0_9GLOM|nr:hypothetical protein Glove_81g61 [Diversispora epigaea]